MSATSGRMMSSPNDTEEQQHKSGLFFQLFDWNRKLSGKRFFSNKFLPGEKPKQVSKNFKDEKLPMAKFLLIADENRGGFPNTKSNVAHEALPFSTEVPGQKKNRHTPGVVARLMGLESMPSPGPHLDGKRSSQNRKAVEIYPLQDLLHKKHEESMLDDSEDEEEMEIRRHSLNGKPNGSSIRKSIEVSLERQIMQSSHKKPSARSVTEALPQSGDSKVTKALLKYVSKAPADRLDDPKAILFSRLPSLSPRRLDSPLRSILSPSKSHNKLCSPIKSPLATKSAVRLFEAATKILEPSMQPSNRSRNPSIRSAVSRPLLRDADDDDKSGKKTTRTPSFASKNVPSALVKGVRGQPLNKSWSGTNADQSHQRNGWGMNGKRRSELPVSSRPCSADPPGRNRRDGSFPQRSQLRSEHMKTGDSSKRQEKKSSNTTELKSESGLREQDHSPWPDVGTSKGQLPSDQEMLHKIGNLKEDNAVLSSGQHLVCSNSVKEEQLSTGLAHAQHDPNRQTKGGKEERVKAETRQRVISAHKKPDSASATSSRQQQSTRKSNREPVKYLGIRNLQGKQTGVRPDRDIYAPKGNRAFHNESANRSLHTPGFSQSPDACSQSLRSSVSQGTKSLSTCSSTNPGNSSGTLSYGRLFGSRKDGKIGVNDREERKGIETTQKKVESSLMRSLLRRRIASNDEASADKYSCREPKDKESNCPSELSSANSSACMMSDQDASSSNGTSIIPNTAVSREDTSMVLNHSYEGNSHEGVSQLNGSQISTELMTCVSPDIVVGESSSEVWIQRNTLLGQALNHSPESMVCRSSEIFATDKSSQGSCCGSSFGDLKDTASSDAYPDFARKRAESLSLNGKTTAAILQELLMALNASRSSFSVEKCDDSRVCDSGFSSGSERFSGFEDPGANKTADKRESCNGVQIRADSGDSGLANYEKFLYDNHEDTLFFRDKLPARGRVRPEESDSLVDSVYKDGCGQPSPVSILDSPFQYKFNFSDGSESVQETKDEDSKVACSSGLLEREEEDDHGSSSIGNVESHKIVGALLNISRMHHIDPSSIGLVSDAQLIIRDEEHYVREIICAGNLLSENSPLHHWQLQVPPIDSELFGRLEKQVTDWGWRTFPENCIPSDENTAEDCSEADLETSFREMQQEEASRQHRKVVFDCVNEALSLQPGFSSDNEAWLWSSSALLRPEASSGACLVRAVYGQIQGWKKMAGGTMLDDLVEKDMSSYYGKWRDFDGEVAEIGVEIERNIFRVLIEELVGELTSNWLVNSSSKLRCGLYSSHGSRALEAQREFG